MLRIAFLHLAPVAGDLAGNRVAIGQGVAWAVAAGADWILTPELATTGYSFAAMLGTGWIQPGPDAPAAEIAERAARGGAALFLGAPEQDPATAALHNTLFAFGADGVLAARHRKVNTLRVGAEAWSSPGTATAVADLGPGRRAGLLICADACTGAIGDRLHEDGADLLVSAAAWAPGLYGPDGEWEALTLRTGLPLFVCNRTGSDPALDFTPAETVIADRGERLLSRAFPCATVLVVEWDEAARTVVGTREWAIAG